MIILTRHAQSEGNSTSRSLLYVTRKLIRSRKPRYSPNSPRPPRKTHTRWLETSTLPSSTPSFPFPQTHLYRPKKQATSSALSSALQTPSIFLPLPIEEHEKRPKESSTPSHLLPQTTNPLPSHGTRSKCMKSRDYENKILETFSPILRR